MQSKDLGLKKHIKEFCSYIEGEDESEMLLADGFEKAFIGVGTQFTNAPIALYDYNKCIQELIDQFQENDPPGEEDEERDLHTEAVEYMDFNVTGAWAGERTPMFVVLFEDIYQK